MVSRMMFAGADWRKFPKAFAFVVGVGVAAVAFAAEEKEQFRIWVDCVLVCRRILNDGDVRDRNSGLVRDYGRVRDDSLVRDYGCVREYSLVRDNLFVRDAHFIGVPVASLNISFSHFVI